MTFYHRVLFACYAGQNTRVPTGPVRLWRNGATSLSYTSGRVQISFAFAWGNICDDTDFGLREADVICHQLGYTGASNQSRAEFDRSEFVINEFV